MNTEKSRNTDTLTKYLDSSLRKKAKDTDERRKL